MPLPVFRGDPFRVLGVDPGATDAALKRRWRELVREHHPDRAADPAETERLTRRVARINSAYDALRDPVRRADYRARSRAAGWWDGAGRGKAAAGSAGASFAGAPFAGAPFAGAPFAGSPNGRVPGPPPPPTRPVTERVDTTPGYRRRNATLSSSRAGLRGHRPVSSRDLQPDQEPLRASDPTGPVHRRRGGRRPRVPDLAESRAMVLGFGRFRGHTLGQVESFEPTYVDWLARTITRDRDLVMGARVIQADMDERGLERRWREPAAPRAPRQADY